MTGGTEAAALANGRGGVAGGPRPPDGPAGDGPDDGPDDPGGGPSDGPARGPAGPARGPAGPAGAGGGGRRAWPATPLGARLFGAALAVLGVTLLVVGLVTLRGKHPDGARPGAAASPSASVSGPPSTSASGGPTGGPTTTAGSSPSGTPSASGPASTSATAGPTSARPPASPRAPLTVLNNSRIRGLGDRVAGQVGERGWTIALVGNFAGRIPVTTVYFTPGDAAGQRAAQELAAEFPGVQRVFPRYVGLPPTPAGIVLVVTRDWVS